MNLKKILGITNTATKLQQQTIYSTTIMSKLENFVDESFSFFL